MKRWIIKTGLQWEKQINNKLRWDNYVFMPIVILLGDYLLDLEAL